MTLEGGVPVDMFVQDGAPTRGLGAILAGAGDERHALPLARVAVAATVANRIAEVTITQVFRNACSDPIEAVYTFPLDGGSIVSGFEMLMGADAARCPRADAVSATARHWRKANARPCSSRSVTTSLRSSSETCRPARTPRSG